MVDAEEEIEHDADDGQEEDDQHPGHRLGRLTVVHQHVDDSNGYCHPKQRHSDDCQQPVHINSQ